MDLIPWIAVIALCAGYLAQIHKIHVHREVRDLSIISYLSWGLGYLVLSYEAYQMGADIFLAKNAITLGLVAVIVSQIYYHREDEWHDDDDTSCSACGNEIEPRWQYCPDCGQQQESGLL